MRDHQYRGGYDRSFEGKGVEWDGGDNVEHMLEQVNEQWLKCKRNVWLSENGGVERTQRMCGETMR